MTNTLLLSDGGSQTYEPAHLYVPAHYAASRTVGMTGIPVRAMVVSAGLVFALSTAASPLTALATDLPDIGWTPDAPGITDTTEAGSDGASDTGGSGSEAQAEPETPAPVVDDVTDDTPQETTTTDTGTTPDDVSLPEQMGDQGVSYVAQVTAPTDTDTSSQTGTYEEQNEEQTQADEASSTEVIQIAAPMITSWDETAGTLVGTSQAGLTVQAILSDGTVLGQVIVGDDGVFTMTLPAGTDLSAVTVIALNPSTGEAASYVTGASFLAQVASQQRQRVGSEVNLAVASLASDIDTALSGSSLFDGYENRSTELPLSTYAFGAAAGVLASAAVVGGFVGVRRARSRKQAAGQNQSQDQDKDQNSKDQNSNQKEPLAPAVASTSHHQADAIATHEPNGSSSTLDQTTLDQSDYASQPYAQYPVSSSSHIQTLTDADIDAMIAELMGPAPAMQDISGSDAASTGASTATSAVPAGDSDSAYDVDDTETFLRLEGQGLQDKQHVQEHVQDFSGLDLTDSYDGSLANLDDTFSSFTPVAATAAQEDEQVNGSPDSTEMFIAALGDTPESSEAEAPVTLTAPVASATSNDGPHAYTTAEFLALLPSELQLQVEDALKVARGENPDQNPERKDAQTAVEQTASSNAQLSDDDTASFIAAAAGLVPSTHPADTSADSSSKSSNGRIAPTAQPGKSDVVKKSSTFTATPYFAPVIGPATTPAVVTGGRRRAAQAYLDVPVVDAQLESAIDAKPITPAASAKSAEQTMESKRQRLAAEASKMDLDEPDQKPFFTIPWRRNHVAARVNSFGATSDNMIGVPEISRGRAKDPSVLNVRDVSTFVPEVPDVDPVSTISLRGGSTFVSSLSEVVNSTGYVEQAVASTLAPDVARAYSGVARQIRQARGAYDIPEVTTESVVSDLDWYEPDPIEAVPSTPVHAAPQSENQSEAPLHPVTTPTTPAPAAVPYTAYAASAAAYSTPAAVGTRAFDERMSSPAYIDYLVQDEFAHRHDSVAQRARDMGKLQVIDGAKHMTSLSTSPEDGGYVPRHFKD